MENIKEHDFFSAPPSLLVTKISGARLSFPKVNILYSYSGDDGDLAKAAVAAGAKGLVTAGTGAGHTYSTSRS
jgi:L-asparaginase